MQQEQRLDPSSHSETLFSRLRGSLPAIALTIAGLVLIAILVYGRRWLASVTSTLPNRPEEALLGVVDVFSCCVLSWKAFTTMLPAFLLGGAIAAFAPTGLILYYLGPRSNQFRAYIAAGFSGFLLSLCSCSIVPLFASIYRRGAGIGPAFTLLFAGPSIHIVSAIFTFQVINPQLGLWRLVLTPIVGILIGLTMSLIYRNEQAAQVTTQAATQLHVDGRIAPRLWALFGLLLLTVTYGAWNMPWQPKVIGMVICAVLLIALTMRSFEAWERKEWLHETWALVKLVVPVLLPAVLIIGLVAAFIDVKLVSHWVGTEAGGTGVWGLLKPILTAEVFGELMYFPILSEVAFVKAFLKLGMSVGPALAILVSGPGTSLPGAIIIARTVGWVKALLFEFLVIAFTAVFALLFASEVGQYLCACMMNR